MSVFPRLVIVHALAATVWTGGHLVLDLGVLPRALRAQSAAQIRAFEEVFEPLGLTACQPTAKTEPAPTPKVSHPEAMGEPLQQPPPGGCRLVVWTCRAQSVER